MAPSPFERASTQNTETSEHIPQRVFIEIGTHSMPVPYLGEKHEGETYFGIEKDAERVKSARKRAEETHPNDPNMHFLRADAEALPLKSESADEFFLGNVLGDPSISLESKKRFLDEAERILRNGGILTIKETNTPAGLGELREMLQGRSLRPLKWITPKDEGWDEAIRKYYRMGVGTEDFWNVYLAILQKEEKNITA